PFDYGNQLETSYCPQPDENSLDGALEDKAEAAYANITKEDPFSELYNLKTIEIKPLGVNMKRLKTKMWMCLKDQAANHKDQPSPKQEKLVDKENQPIPNIESKQIKFSQILKSTKENISTKDAKNLCFGSSLLGLLHLANEN
ncbi:MAG: hypothetical protein MHPSP_003451, partial [Paramarteilia canceri]